MGSIHLGVFAVSGNNRRPCPALKITAFIGFSLQWSLVEYQFRAIQPQSFLFSSTNQYHLESFNRIHDSQWLCGCELIFTFQGGIEAISVPIAEKTLAPLSVWQSR
jgi:hypothetical protein